MSTVTVDREALIDYFADSGSPSPISDADGLIASGILLDPAVVCREHGERIARAQEALADSLLAGDYGKPSASEKVEVMAVVMALRGAADEARNLSPETT